MNMMISYQELVRTFLNFMGIGGSGKNDLDYPSADIRAKISKDIEGGIPGY